MQIVNEIKRMNLKDLIKPSGIIGYKDKIAIISEYINTMDYMGHAIFTNEEGFILSEDEANLLYDNGLRVCLYIELKKFHKDNLYIGSFLQMGFEFMDKTEKGKGKYKIYVPKWND